MRSGVAAFFSMLFSLLAFVSVAVGLPRIKLGLAGGVPLVIAFAIFIIMAIFFAWLEKKKRDEEQGRLSKW